MICLYGSLGCLWSCCNTRHACPYITTGHFDAIPGELRLKAWESRMMTAFLAVCLRRVWQTCDASLRSAELQLCTSLASQVANWSLDLEQCPIELSYQQAVRLHDSGVEILVKNWLSRTWFSLVRLNQNSFLVQLIFDLQGSARPTRP